MKKPVLWMLLVIVPMILLNACSSFPLPLIPEATPEPTTAPQRSQPGMSILVPQFYDSGAGQIRVGNYSQQLATDNLQELTGLAEEMARQKAELTPEQMFVLAIRLYDLGEKDDSVYWFYEAQFRAKLFLKTLDREQMAGAGGSSSELLASYDSFTKLAGRYINGYAGCDVDNWMRIAQNVREDNQTPPELDKLFPEAVFVERSQWQGINDEVGAGLGGLIDQLSSTKDAIRRQRETENTDALYCQ